MPALALNEAVSAGPAAIDGSNLDSPPSQSVYISRMLPLQFAIAVVLLTVAVVLVGLRFSGLWLGIGNLTSRGARTRTRQQDMDSGSGRDGLEQRDWKEKWKMERFPDDVLPLPTLELELDADQQYTPVPLTQEPASYFWADGDLRPQHSLLSTWSHQSSSSSNSVSSSAGSAPAISPLSPQSDIPRRRSYTKTVETSAEEVEMKGQIQETESWRRHTRVYGGGVCLACLESEERNEKIRKMLLEKSPTG